MIQFTEKDAQTCFACGVQKPEFRLVSLERVTVQRRISDADMCGHFGVQRMSENCL